MTSPTITYGHGFLDDGDDTTDWSETESGITGTLESVYGSDVLRIKCEDVDDAGDEYVYYENDIDNISSDTYTKYLVRYKTSASSNGCGIRVKLIFTSGTQWILGETEPAFSTSFTTVSGDITSGKTIDKIQFWADDYPDSVNSGTYYVYFDFILLHRGTFTFPQVDNIRSEGLLNDVELLIPGRTGGITQSLGSPLITIRMDGPMETSYETWKLDPTTGNNTGAYGEVLYYIYHRSCSADGALAVEPWQWFTSDVFTGKVRMQLPKMPSQEKDSKVQRKWEALLKEYRLGASEYIDYKERFGL